MKQIYTDASFDYRHTDETDEPVVRGKICVVCDDFKIIEKVAIGKVPKLKQYINVLELIAIARAIEVAAQRQWDKDIRITTDSNVARVWASSGKVNKKVETEAHTNALEYLARVRKEFGGIITFYQVPRESNPAGFVLEAELERERPHAI